MKTGRSVELNALLELLADGEWHPGIRAMHAIGKVIPPAQADRGAKDVLRRPEAMTLEQRIESYRRMKSREVITSALQRGGVVTDVEKLGREHWSGQEPWQIRNPMAGYCSVQEVADELDIGTSVLRTWISAGHVPYSTSAGGQIRFSPTEFEICRRVREIYPGPGKMRWPVDPRSLWQEQGMIGLVCPHCNENISVTLGKA